MMRKSPGQAVREVGRRRIMGSLDGNMWMFAMAIKASRCPREESDKILIYGFKDHPQCLCGERQTGKKGN